MKRQSKNKNNFVDALAMEMRYAVLTKAGRVQILVSPRPKDLRRRGKRGWHLFATVENNAESRQTLLEKMEAALADVEGVTLCVDSNGTHSEP